MGLAALVWVGVEELALSHQRTSDGRSTDHRVVYIVLIRTVDWRIPGLSGPSVAAATLILLLMQPLSKPRMVGRLPYRLLLCEVALSLCSNIPNILLGCFHVNCVLFRRCRWPHVLSLVVRVRLVAHGHVWGLWCPLKLLYVWLFLSSIVLGLL